jgi:hypothetical protein
MKKPEVPAELISSALISFFGYVPPPKENSLYDITVPSVALNTMRQYELVY